MDAWVCGRWNVPAAQPWPGTLKAQGREHLAIPQTKRQSSDTAEPRCSLEYPSLASLSDIQHPKVTAIAQKTIGFSLPMLYYLSTHLSLKIFTSRKGHSRTFFLSFPIHIFCQKQQAPHSWISSSWHSCELLPTAKAPLWVHQGLRWHTGTV